MAKQKKKMVLESQDKILDNHVQFAFCVWFVVVCWFVTVIISPKQHGLLQLMSHQTRRTRQMWIII